MENSADIYTNDITRLGYSKDDLFWDDEFFFKNIGNKSYDLVVEFSEQRSLEISSVLKDMIIFFNQLIERVKSYSSEKSPKHPGMIDKYEGHLTDLIDSIDGLINPYSRKEIVSGYPDASLGEISNRELNIFITIKHQLESKLKSL